MNELDLQLRQAGQTPVPPPDAAFATRLEERLRSGALAPEPTPVRPASRRRGAGAGLPAGRWYPGLVAMAAALAVVLGTVAVRDGGEEIVRVASATDTFVVLPDGTVGPATPGLVIPDGSRLQTGSEGHVVAGETELGPKQQAKVKKGTVKPSATPLPPAKPSGPSTPLPTAPTATTARPGDPPTATTAPSATRPPDTKPPVVTPTTRKPTTNTTKPATKPPACPAPTPSDTGPTNTSPSTTAIRPANTPAALKLDARFKEQHVKLQWSRYDGKDFAAYLVLRSDGPVEPGYPVDEGTTVVARITDPAAACFVETIADPAARVYRVVAVDSERRLIASSPAAKPQPLG